MIDGIISEGPGPFLLTLGSTKGILFTPSPLPGARIKVMDGAGYQEDYVDLGQVMSPGR